MKEINKENKIFTIPNIITMFRIVLIPIFIFCYFKYENVLINASLILLSAFSDVIDGIIARKFNLISNLGKYLDPIADKLSLFTLCLCLSIRYNYLFLLFIILLLRDGFMLFMGAKFLLKYKYTYCAKWYGKVATASCYLCFGLHILWVYIPSIILQIIFLIASCFVLTSFILYMCFEFKMLRKLEQEFKVKKEHENEKNN